MIRPIMLLMLFISASPAVAQTVSITGTVQDAQRDAPLVGVPVYLIGTSLVAITRADGRFVIQGVEAGTYPIMTVYEGYSSVTDTLVVSGDADIKNDFDLIPVDGTGEEVAGAAPTRGQETASHPATQNRDGRFSELKTVCDCFDSAIGILDEAIRLRKKYDNEEQYREDQEAIEQMNALLQTWREAQQQCLTRFGTKLFIDSACNRPHEVSDRRSELSRLGIRT